MRQLGAKFQVKITRPDTLLRLNSLATGNQLAVGVHKNFVVVSYGEVSQEGMSPNAEVVFDIGESGDLVASEVLYTTEVWNDFQKTLAESGLSPPEEQSFTGERFALYLLGKIAREKWQVKEHSL